MTNVQVQEKISLQAIMCVEDSDESSLSSRVTANSRQTEPAGVRARTIPHHILRGKERKQLQEDACPKDRPSKG